MNRRHGEHNQFVMDFTDDCAEREAADMLAAADESAA
jgi:hypothetical protein